MKDKRMPLTEIRTEKEMYNGLIVMKEVEFFEIIEENGDLMTCIARVEVKKRGRRYCITIEDRTGKVARVRKVEI